jgi:hypothetical protein
MSLLKRYKFLAVTIPTRHIGNNVHFNWVFANNYTTIILQISSGFVKIFSRFFYLFRALIFIYVVYNYQNMINKKKLVFVE